MGSYIPYEMAPLPESEEIPIDPDKEPEAPIKQGILTLELTIQFEERPSRALVDKVLSVIRYMAGIITKSQVIDSSARYTSPAGIWVYKDI